MLYFFTFQSIDLRCPTWGGACRAVLRRQAACRVRPAPLARGPSWATRAESQGLRPPSYHSQYLIVLHSCTTKIGRRFKNCYFPAMHCLTGAKIQEHRRMKPKRTLLLLPFLFFRVQSSQEETTWSRSNAPPHTSKRHTMTTTTTTESKLNDAKQRNDEKRRKQEQRREQSPVC